MASKNGRLLIFLLPLRLLVPEFGNYLVRDALKLGTMVRKSGMRVGLVERVVG